MDLAFVSTAKHTTDTHFLKSFQKIIDHVVRLYADDSTYEPWPGYKAMATRMCQWYNFDPRDGNGLGRHEQGNPAPIDQSPSNLNRTVKNRTNPKRALRKDVRISLDGDQHYVFEKNKVHMASLKELGEIVVDDIYYGDLCDLELSDLPAVRWGNGYKGTAATQFPHPDMYSLQDSRIPLDQITVRHLTRTLSTPKRRFPRAKDAWRKRILIKDHHWDEVAARCNTTFLTPTDFHTHFKHIIHHALVTRERGCSPPENGTLCRMCGLGK
jgi:hypothetical protein